MFACVFAHDLPVQVEQQRLGAGHPLIIRHPLEAEMVWAASAGVPAGQPVYRARQSAPAALVVEPDEEAYHARHAALESALRAFSPAIETVTLGEFLLDARGLDRLHGSFQSAAAAIQAAAHAASGLSIRVGGAANRFSAQQAARQAPRDAALVVPPGKESTFLALLSIDVLPGLPGELRRRLLLLDLKTLGDLAGLPRPAVLRQFGPEMAPLYELARGRDPRPLNPDVPPLRVVRALELPEPVADKRTVLNLANHLCRKLAQTLKDKGYHAEALRLTLVSEGGRESSAGQAAKPPTSDEGRLRFLAAQLLGHIQVASPNTRLSLSAYPLRSWHLGAYQLALVDPSAGSGQAGVAQKRTRLEETLQLLAHRFGQAVVRIAALLGPPLPLAVRVSLGDLGLPRSVEIGGEIRLVSEIHEHWRLEKWWWDRPVKRDYYRLLLADGTLRNVFQDQVNGGWYLDRAWPIL
jgi:nucleotidyltransferase/DNA polymerase involved in DNA repair